MNKKTIKNINFFSSDKTIKNIHFIGIGGVGMGGIALILLKLGYKISGSDLINNSITKKLTKLGAIIHFQHSEKNIKQAELIIKSSAIPENNLEIVAAKKLNIIILLRAEIIQILMKFKSGIAISGTHGKTTTTSMIVDIFTSIGLDITFINGGLIKSINSHAKIGLSPWFVVEADESDASFLYFRPQIAVVTNIEPEHMENYHHDYNKLKKTFLKFLQNIPLSGTSVICIDNQSICDILPYIKCKKITYGFNKYADIHICKYQQKKFTGQFTLNIKNEKQIDIILNIPGKHNALNAAAAIAVAFSINSNLSFNEIILCLKNFQGTARRFENIGSVLIPRNNLNNTPTILIDDYGHHPTELSETIKTIRISWPKKCLIMIFEPHRYTRTYTLYYDFIKILTTVDILFLLNIYSANEKFYPKINSYILCKDIKKLKKNYVQFVENPRLILDYLAPKLTGNDIILTQGAGKIEKIAQKILIHYKKI